MKILEPIDGMTNKTKIPTESLIASNVLPESKMINDDKNNVPIICMAYVI